MPAFGLTWFRGFNPALLSVSVHSRGPSKYLNHYCILATLYGATPRSKHDYLSQLISDETPPSSHSLSIPPSK